MSNKLRATFIFLAIMGLIGSIYLLVETNDAQISGNENSIKTVYIYADYIVDISNDRELAGVSHNIFVGEVIEQTGNLLVDDMPNTQFKVNVLNNIKGNLTGPVIVNQEGGYITTNDTQYLYLMENDKLLQPGNTYLFATRASEKGWHTAVPVYGDVLIKDENDLREKTERFKTAYKNEISVNEALQKE
jgi:hypothetical protein